MDALDLNDGSAGLLARRASQSNFALVTLLALLACCPDRVLAQTAARPYEPKAYTRTRETRDETSVENIPELQPGQIVGNELKRGQSHRYRIALQAGEYMRVAVDQQRVDLKVQALDPAGRAIAEISVAGKGPGESIWAVAQTGGEYQIKITAPMSIGSYGPYTVSLEKVGELRTASTLDQSYLKAHRLLFEGDELARSGEQQSLLRAVECLQEALALWRQLGEPAEEAYTLHELGYCYAGLSDPKALDFYSQAIVAWQAVKNHELDEAATLYNMGSIYAFSGKTTEALDCYRKSIALRRALGDRSGLAYALTNLGQLYINIGEFQAALKSHEEALRLRREVQEVEGEARSLSNIAGVYFRLGEFQEALNYSLQALPLRRKAGDRRGEAITLNNLGTTYRELGEPKEALGYYQQALSLIHRLDSQRSDDRYVEGSIFDGMGRSFYELGDYAKALDTFNQSLALRQMPKEPYGEAATLTNIGSVYARMENDEKALAYYQQSLELERAIGDRRGQALTLQKAGELLFEAREFKKAREYLNEGLALSIAIKNRSSEANLLYDLARLDKDAGNATEARSNVEAAIKITESARASIGSSDLRASFLAAKQDFYELDIDLLMQSYQSDRSPESLTQAFIVSEQRRARSLLDSLDGARENIRVGVSPELLARERELRAQLNQKAESQIKLLSGMHTAAQATALAEQIDRLTADYEQLLAGLRVSAPRYAELTQSIPLTLKELQTELLDPDTLLLEYSLGKERSYLWAITSSDIAGYELPGRAEIESQVRNVYGLLTARERFVKFEKPEERQARIAKADAEYFPAASQLSRTLLGPVTGRLKAKRLLVVCDGALQYLPFAALPSPASVSKENEKVTSDGDRPLIADHEITSLPSASILSVLREEMKGKNRPPRTVAVLADPVFSKTDERVTSKSPHAARSSEPNPHLATDETSERELVRAVRDVGTDNVLEIDRLPFTRQEAEAILRLAPKSDELAVLDFDANRSTATDPRLAQYRIVHFATHGLLNSAHPDLSGLIFSLVDRQGNDQKGFLAAHDILSLNLPADLVVLSGCQTGLGKEIKGEGMLSITRSFFYAGAARVAVSLWDVNDKSTAELMTRFYGALLTKKQLSPAAALRESQIAMWKSNRWHAPYYWAAFVLQGEYR